MKQLINFFISNKILSGSLYLTLGQLLFNGVGLITSLVMSNIITAEDFGVLAMLSSFFFLIGIPAGALGQTVERYIAFLAGKDKQNYAKVRRITFQASLIAAVAFNTLYILAIPGLAAFFQLSSVWPLIWFAPVIGSSFLLSWYKSFLKGHFRFGAESFLLVLEGVVKLGVIFLTYLMGWGLIGAIAAFWVSIIAVTLVSWWYVSRYVSLPQLKSTRNKKKKRIHLSELVNYYSHTALSQLGLMVLVSVDILLVKHFVEPLVAGQYALLSIFGKLILLGATSLTGTLSPLIARESGTTKARQSIFVGYVLLSSFILVSLVFFTFFATQSAQLLLRDKGASIAHLLPQYSLAVGFITLGLFTIQANLNQKRMSFALIPILFALLMAWLLSRQATEVTQVVHYYLYTAVGFAVTSFLWFLGVELRRWHQRISQFIGFPIANSQQHRILFMNWRDIRHVWAGGAEVYVHELSRRFVAQGHQVIVFAGNDRQSPELDTIEGIKIIRRGGFYTVYLWAFIYFILFFRNKIDVVIDCENGIPFFTPFYTRVPKFLVVHHIHQEVFMNQLPWLKSKLAQFLEGKLMPWAYRNVPLITVSESSREELLAAQIAQDCQLVHNGVDLEKYGPGKKSIQPMILYVGRLKAYKSIDVLIKAADLVKNEIPHIRFVIAGYGEEMENLQNLVKKLGLTPYFTFTGKISEQDKLAFYKQAWVVVNPSFMEGFGITSIEANASGSVMIAADVPGLRDSVKDGYSGILVPYGDVGAFAEAISYLIKNHEIRTKMERYALSWSRRYSWDRSNEEFLRLIKNALNKPTPAPLSLASYISGLLVVLLIRPTLVLLRTNSNLRKI